MARFGVEGATLERTAAEAGLARALIRHNVGNKDELLDAFLDRFLGGGAEATREFFASLPETDRVSTMIEWLFEPRQPDAQEVNVTNSLFVAATERSALAARLRRWTDDFIKLVQRELENEFPDADGTATAAVATGVVGIYFNLDTLLSLGEADALRRASETAASLLVSTLEY